MAQADSLRRFLFERYPFRGQLVHLGSAWQAMMEHHDYPPQVRDSLGEAVVAAALLALDPTFVNEFTDRAQDPPIPIPDRLRNSAAGGEGV